MDSNGKLIINSVSSDEKTSWAVLLTNKEEMEHRGYQAVRVLVSTI